MRCVYFLILCLACNMYLINNNDVFIFNFRIFYCYCCVKLYVVWRGGRKELINMFFEDRSI